MDENKNFMTGEPNEPDRDRTNNSPYHEGAQNTAEQATPVTPTNQDASTEPSAQVVGQGSTIPKQESPTPVSPSYQTTYHDHTNTGSQTYQGYGYNYNQYMAQQQAAQTQQPSGNPTSNPQQTEFLDSISPIVAPTPESKQKKKQKSHSGWGVKIAAIALICALAGGAVGGGTTYLLLGNNPTNSNSSTPATNVNIDESYNSSVEAIADKVLPSVVGIRASYQSAGGFFGQSTQSSSEGSGVIYREDGYIITNYHVVEGAKDSGTINVYMDEHDSDGTEATIVGYDAGADLAVLKINKTGLTPIEIADSDQIKVGQVAVAVGNPGGLQFMGSVSEGIVSGLNRTLTLESGQSMGLIQTDAAINPGNSGGALVDGTGKLIGINSAKLASSSSSSTSFEGMGFAIPSNEVVEICDRLINNEGKKAAYLGVTIDMRYTTDVLQSMGYPQGMVVSSVVENSPAGQAGIQGGDIITAMDGTELTSYDILASELAKHAAGDQVTLEVFRLGQTLNVTVTLGETSAS